VVLSGGAKLVCTGAEPICIGLKLLGTAPVSVSSSIVPAPTAESMAPGWLNQLGDGIRTAYAYDLFESIQRVFKQRE
jgi:hypothetical protein